MYEVYSEADLFDRHDHRAHIFAVLGFLYGVDIQDTSQDVTPLQV